MVVGKKKKEGKDCRLYRNVNVNISREPVSTETLG